MKGLFAAVAVVAAMVGSDASASDWNPETGAVYTACKLVEGKTNFTLYGQDLFLAGQCMGSVMSVAHLVAWQCAFGSSNYGNYRANLTNASPLAMVQAFINYAKERPQDWDNLAAISIAEALENYFPCDS